MIAWLAHTLFASSLLMMVVLVLREPVRRQFGAPAAYALWLLPALRMVMPPITRTVERIIPSASPAKASALSLTSSRLTPTIAPDPSLIERLAGWSSLLIAMWAAGALLFLAIGLIRYRRQRRAALDGSVQVARLGSIRLVRSFAVRGPIAFGILDKVIAVPADFDERFDYAQRRLALDHELAHHRSGDLIVNHIGFVLLSLQWFNPLAWMSHAAFRFDQEAACDCRILDKAGPADRVDYGRTIAKAASGKALLFASVLDHNKTLHRRLKSMLTNPTPRRRIAGQLLVVGTLAVALPLTATRAIDYVDVAAPLPSPPLVPPVPHAPPAPLPAMAPLPPSPPVPSVTPRDRGKITINGHEKDWSEMTPQEQAQVQSAMAQARRAMADIHINRAQIQSQLAATRAELAANRVEMRQEMIEARREVDRALREIDRNAAQLRRAGQDPEAIKASVRASLRAVDAIDVAAITDRALASVRPELIERSLRAAEEGISKATEAMDDAADRDDD